MVIMVSKKIKTVKRQLLMFMILFAATVTTLVTAFSFYLSYSFQKGTVIQATQYNLKLMSDMAAVDLRALRQLAAFCANSAQITSYFTETREPKAKAIGLAAFDRLQEEYRNSRVSRYIQRIIVVSNSSGRILQTGGFQPASLPVTRWTVGRMDGLKSGSPYEWRLLNGDPFLKVDQDQYIAFFCPVYNVTDRTVIGTVFMEASASIITDKLASYSLPEDSRMYINLGADFFIDDRGEFFPVENAVALSEFVRPGEETFVTALDLEAGQSVTLVGCVAGEDMVLAQTLEGSRFIPAIGAWTALLAGVCAVVILSAVAIIYWLERYISLPVSRLRKKLDAIASGDFSPDTSLEIDSELGIIGRGINNLSKNVVALMETRVKDEQNRKDLEYRMLQAQINPHFMYNTLNSIKWMATIQNATGIAEVTTSLSRLLRTVSKDMRKEVTLSEELGLLDDYLVIQRYRSGGGIRFTKSIAPEVLDTPIPRFSLQPLVENAIFHGVEPKGSGSVEIAAIRDGDDALITVTDDGVGISADQIEKLLTSESKSGMLGLGLANVSQRARLAFGRDYGLTIDSRVGRYTVMKLRVPAKGGARSKD
ncbi:MAG: sensor histidine kinase [Clostridiales bacterium]|jgi:two-component system sensor histidine kinase YesM|nr:sensor histidine kinase [Clostridiales bacterium]